MQVITQELKLIKPTLFSPVPYILTAVAVPMAWFASNANPPVVVVLGIIAFILALQTVIDLRTRQLPHLLNALLAVLGLAFSYHFTTSLPSALAAGVLTFLMFLAMGALASKLAKKPALGGGDIYLVAALGICFGLSGIPPFMLAIGLLGLAALAWRSIKGQKGRLAFGPILALAGWLTILYQGHYWKCITSLMA